MNSKLGELVPLQMPLQKCKKQMHRRCYWRISGKRQRIQPVGGWVRNWMEWERFGTASKYWFFFALSAYSTTQMAYVFFFNSIFFLDRNFISRLGNIFYAPEWFTKGLPRDKTLDGELFGGRKQFQSTVSIVKSQDQSEKWKQLVFRGKIQSIVWFQKIQFLISLQYSISQS